MLSSWTVVVAGPAGQELARASLRPGVPLTIGRAPESSIMLGAMTVSRHHGRIELVNGMPRYHHEPGALTTLIDGDPVEGSAPVGERTLLEIGAYRITLQRQRTATLPPTRPAAAEVPAPEAGATLLDRHIQGVRLHRTEAQKEAESRAVRWDRDWQEVVRQVRQIQARYGRHPDILEFAVSKDEREVVIKLKDDSPRGYAYFCLSRAHPEGKYPDLQSVWLREVGRGDDSFSEPLRGLEELVSRVAPRLA